MTEEAVLTKFLPLGQSLNNALNLKNHYMYGIPEKLITMITKFYENFKPVFQLGITRYPISST